MAKDKDTQEVAVEEPAPPSEWVSKEEIETYLAPIRAAQKEMGDKLDLAVAKSEAAYQATRPKFDTKTAWEPAPFSSYPEKMQAGGKEIVVPQRDETFLYNGKTIECKTGYVMEVPVEIAAELKARKII